MSETVTSPPNEHPLKESPESVQQIQPPKKKKFYSYDNIIAFRANEVELTLLKQLQKAWQLPNISAVLHRILASFHGVVEERKEVLSKIRQLIKKWQYTEWEIFRKGDDDL